MTRNYIIIIGAMKSGTTTLFDILAKHPRICPAHDKEPGFFAFDEVWDQGFDWFDTLFDFDPDQHTYRLEASTDYTKAPFATGVWDRMTADPDVQVKLLYIMRHPFRRLESHARHVQVARRELGRAICDKEEHNLDSGLSLLNLATSRYAEQLDQYPDAWAAGNLHCLTLEDLRDQPEATLRKIYNFLGLGRVAISKSGEAPVSNPARARVKPTPMLRSLNKVKPLVGAGKVLLPVWARKAIKNGLSETVTATGRFSLSKTEEQALLAHYADDLTRLRDVYGVDPTQKWQMSLPSKRPVGITRAGIGRHRA